MAIWAFESVVYSVSIIGNVIHSVAKCSKILLVGHLGSSWGGPGEGRERIGEGLDLKRRERARQFRHVSFEVEKPFAKFCSTVRARGNFVT